MKKIIALCLAVVMLLGMVAMTASADSNILVNYRLELASDIAINWDITGLTPGQEYDVVITKDSVDGTVVSEGKVEGKEGVTTYKFVDLSPADVDTTYYITVDGASFSGSVLANCQTLLADMTKENELFTLIVDLLNYAAASQAYLKDAVTANTTLTDLQKLLGTAEAAAPATPYVGAGEQSAWTYQWTEGRLVLGESIVYRFFFDLKGTEPADLKFKVTVDGEAKDDITTDKAGYVDFTELTPADLRKPVVITAFDGDTQISSGFTFSAEQYAYYATITNPNFAAGYEGLAKLLDATLAYGDATADYVDGDNLADLTEAGKEEKTIAKSNPFDLYRKIMSMVELDVKTMVGVGTGTHAGAAYKAVGLDILSGSLYDLDANWKLHDSITLGIFDNTGSASSTTIRNIKTSSDDGYIANFANMLVENSWGGPRVSIEDRPDTPIADVCANLQIGDIMILRCNASSAYDLTLLYVGDNKFIGGISKSTSGGGSEGRYVYGGLTVAQLMEIISSPFAEFTGRTAAGTVTTYKFTEVPRHYYVIRPSQLLTQAN